MNVLFIEDEFAARIGLTLILEGKSHKVDQAGNGEDALECLKKKSYDLLLLDIMIPSNNSDSNSNRGEIGKEILLKLRSSQLGNIKTNKNVPVVVITAVSDYNLYLTFAKMPFTFVLHKPITPEESINKIEEFLKKN
jgi:CheY-like chemotaxis protein